MPWSYELAFEQSKVQFDIDSQDTLVKRAKSIALTIFFFHIITTALDIVQLDLSFGAIYAAKIPMVTMSLIIMLFGSSQWLAGRIKMHLCLMLVFMMYSVYIKSVQYQDLHTLTLVALIVCVVSSYLIPWNFKYHLVVTSVALGAITYSIVDSASTGLGFSISRETVVIVSICVLSIFATYIFDGKRFLEWKAQKAMEASAVMFRQLADHTSDIVFLWKADLSIEYVSPSFERYTGRQISDILNTSLKVSDMLDPAQVEKYQQATLEVLEGKERRMDLRVIHVRGTEFLLEAWGSPIFGPDGKVDRAISIWRDVTERSAKERTLELLAVQDSLTKVFNQQHFRRLASAEIKKTVEFGGNLTFIYLDIDKFDRIIERHGLNIGDQVIIEVKERCRALLEDQQVMARYGGHNFLIMLPNMGTEESVRMAKNIKLNIADELVLVDDNLLSVTASVGVVSYDPEFHCRFDDLLEHAVQAARRSNQGGGNATTVWPFAEDQRA